MIDTFFFIKTAHNLGTSDDAVFAFAAGFPYSIGKATATRPADINDPHKIEMIGFGTKKVTWKDGLIFRFKSNVAPQQISKLMVKSLPAFERWTIFQINNMFQESRDGPLKEFAWTMYVGRTAQIYMMSKPGDKELPSLMIDIQSKIRGPSIELIDYIDGKILFVTTDQPARIIANRCTNTLNKLDNWAIIDSNQDTLCKFGGRAIWHNIELPALRFLSDEEERAYLKSYPASFLRRANNFSGKPN
jgi:hypothetical protein